MKRVMGARVTRVNRQRQTPAARAGIRPDDIIIAFNGVTVVDLNHLINLVGIAAIGEPVNVNVFRQGRQLAVKVTLMDRDTQRSAADSSGTFLQR